MERQYLYASYFHHIFLDTYSYYLKCRWFWLMLWPWPLSWSKVSLLYHWYNSNLCHKLVLDIHESLKKSYLSRFGWEKNPCTFCQIPLKKFLLMLNLTDLVRRCSNLAGAQLLSKRYEGGHLRAPQQKGDRLVSGEIGISWRGGNSKNKQLNSQEKKRCQ